MSTRLTQNPQVAGQPVLSESSTPVHTVGDRLVASGGRAYRYVKAGASALVPGKLYDGPANVANHTNVTVYAAAAIGATSVTVTLGATAATANQYAGGIMIVNDVTGEGYTYEIKSNPAADASATLTLTLEDALVIALDTSSQVTLIPNQYSGVIIHAATETGVPLGVAVYPITANYYGWVQTRGPVSLLQDASAGALGQAVAASTTTDGSGTVGTGALVPIGSYLATGVSTEYNAVYLQLD